jgi:cytochrome c peroxidase
MAVDLSAGVSAWADPLLDAWIEKAPGQPAVLIPARAAAGRHEPVGQDAFGARQASAQEPMVRLGEALFFTTAMAPWNSAEGPLSRFTCETCHYEGYVDGRIHHTGRGDVHAVTKPLLGLFNNRPHFSRALDDDLATVSFNEFRVANARSAHDPWFALSIEQFPWLGALGLGDAELSPELLRRGLMSFLMSFSHRPNPMALGRVQFSDGERRGAALFRDGCESCHQARLVSDVPQSRVPFEEWERFVFSRPGPIVWAKAEYEKTGIMPYVHERGARVPSLRRLFKKRPYFTNGSAKTLEAVLEEARFDADHFWHAEPQDGAAGARLAADERKALLEFLDLL